MDLPIKLDVSSGIPVYIQLAEKIRILIREGILQPGDTMPTTRALAVTIGINVNTVARVYRDLQNDGELHLKRGLGTFVSEQATKPMSKEQFLLLEKKAAELIEISKQVGLSSNELAQLITTRWKEDDHV